MTEYIKREKAITEINKGDLLVGDNAKWAKEILYRTPTADVVPVVRCKDCKYYEIHKPSVTLNCERDGRLIPMMPDDYCSYGVRRTD